MISKKSTQLNTECAKYVLGNKYQISRIKLNSGIDRYCRILETWYRTITTVNFAYIKNSKIKYGGFVHFCHKSKGFVLGAIKTFEVSHINIHV